MFIRRQKRGGHLVIDYLFHCQNVVCLDAAVGKVPELILDVNILDHVPIQRVVTWLGLREDNLMAEVIETPSDMT